MNRRLRAPVQGARSAIYRRVRMTREEWTERSDYAVGVRARKQLYSSAVRGRMETQSVGSFHL